MSEQSRFVIVWFIASLVTVFITMQLTSASYVDGQYLPVGQDSFYHARRILDAVASGHLYQFDPFMHVPEGDWVSWPWMYDLVLAKVVRLVLQVTGSGNPVVILMHLPPLLAVAAVGLVVGICAELRLPAPLAMVASLCFALHAYTEYHFGVGSLDHHGTEQIATLGAVWLGLRWFGEPASAVRAIALGLWLGLAMGVHTGLFMLQLPLLAAVCLAWAAGTGLPPRSARWFVAGLLAGTLLVLLPAGTFWSTRFVVYYLSWLQLYVSACTCAVVVFISRSSFSQKRMLQLAALGAALAVPLLSAVAFSRGFLSGDLAAIAGIDEIHSPYAIAREPSGLRRINQIYTLLVWTAPVAWLASVAMAWRDRKGPRVYFWVASVFGLTLLPLQLRMASFGIYYLYLPALVLAGEAMNRWPRAAPALWVAVVGSLIAAYYPTVRYQLFGGNLPAAEVQYATLRPLIPVLRKACAADPGVVLAEPGDGHLVRYFTNCSVIANNFRVTPLDVAKIRESEALISMPIETVRQRAPQVKYVIARLVAPIESPNPVLYKQLLTSASRPPGVDALAELTVTHPDGRAEKFLGVYRLAPTAH